MSSESEAKSDAAHATVTYTEEFLRQFKDVKYEVLETVKTSELYIFAPKPPIHRPRVDRSRSKEGPRTKSFLTAGERQELQRRRRDDEKRRQDELKDGGTPSKAARPAKPATPVKEQAPSTPLPATDSAGLTSEDEKGDDKVAHALLDAQEQQLMLAVPDATDDRAANKPELRSLLPRNKKSLTVETDERRLSQRLKQVEYGKVTHGYKCYVRTVPRMARKKYDPQTPNAAQKCSKRSWDGQIRKWRKQLHKYDDLYPVEGNDPLSAAEPTSGTDTSDVDDTPKKLPPMPPQAKPPVVSREERDELAKVRKELEGKKATTPVKAAPEGAASDV